MLLKYFYNQKLAHASYLVGCQATGEAIVIDPGRDITPYLREAKSNGMKIVGTTETHIHADFVSGSRELAEQGATLYLSDEGGEGWRYTYLDGYAHRRLKDGDVFNIGNISFGVIHTPGHTPEHIALVLTDKGGGADRPMGVFTGDFVFVGSVGRPDLLEKAAGVADASVVGAKQMFVSLDKFRALPDYLQVWPGHGAGSACGKGLGAVPSSTVGYEKMFNVALSYEDEAEFVAMLLDGQPEPPAYFAVMKRVNKAGADLRPAGQSVAAVVASELPALIGEGAMVIDTRSPRRFAGGHVPGTINIPLGMLAGWAGWLIEYTMPFYLIVDPAGVQGVLEDLAYIGLDKLAGYVDPAGIAELATESYEEVTAEAIAERVKAGEVTLIDVRAKTEWDEGHLPNASHIMLGYLADRADEVANGKPVVVQCRSGARSAVGASVLQARGVNEVMNLVGGYLAWAGAGLPVEK